MCCTNYLTYLLCSLKCLMCSSLLLLSFSQIHISWPSPARVCIVIVDQDESVRCCMLVLWCVLHSGIIESYYAVCMLGTFSLWGVMLCRMLGTWYICGCAQVHIGNSCPIICHSSGVFVKSDSSVTCFLMFIWDVWITCWENFWRCLW